MPPAGQPRRVHAHPVTPAARRQADRAGIPYERPDPQRVDGSTHVALSRSLGRLDSTSTGRVRWLAIAVVALASIAVVGAATSALGLGLASSEATRPTSRPSSVVLVPGLDAARPSPTVAPSPDPTVEPAGLPTGYQWPLDHARITSWFGPLPGQPYLVDGQPFHDGIDVASFCGDHVAAAHDGTVLVAGRDVDPWYGWAGSYAGHEAVIYAKHLLSTLAIEVIVDDGNGYRSVYMHLGKALVKAGQQVRAGQLIGYEGRTGNATGCHLHYSLFDPANAAIFQTASWAIKRWTLPPAEIARIDPLLVLPPMASVDVTWGWGARD